jgi:predicted O-linked N-acetylglucosamine transferase (SPINDLY family)
LAKYRSNRQVIKTFLRVIQNLTQTFNQIHTSKQIIQNLTQTFAQIHTSNQIFQNFTQTFAQIQTKPKKAQRQDKNHSTAKGCHSPHLRTMGVG